MSISKLGLIILNVSVICKYSFEGAGEREAFYLVILYCSESKLFCVAVDIEVARAWCESVSGFKTHQAPRFYERCSDACVAAVLVYDSNRRYIKFENFNFKAAEQ